MPGWVTRSRSGSEQPLNSDELQLLRWGLGGVLALWSVWGVFFFDLEGVALLPFITAAIVAVLVRPVWGERAPAWAWRLVVPGLVAFVAIDLLRSGDPMATLVRVNLLLVAVRAVGPRRPREDRQLVVLCLFLVVAAGVLTVALGFLVHILVFAALALMYLVAITLGGTGERSGGGAEAWRRIPWAKLFARVRGAVDWRIVAGSSCLYLLLVVGASVLFIAMPRFQIENSLGFLQLKNRRALSGFSEVVKLGEVSDIQQDESMALRIELGAGARRPAAPYWRMLALDEYAEGTFRASRGLLQHDRRVAETRTHAGELTVGAGAGSWTFYLEPGISRHVPLPGAFGTMRLREARSLVVNPRAHTVALREEPQAMFAFRLEGVDPGAPPVDALLLPELRRAVDAGATGFPRTLVQVPDGAADRAALGRMVGEIAGGERLPVAVFAERAAEWLGRRHRYALASRVPAGAGDVLVRWMDGETPGHCELFAGSLVLLARRAGYPARLVVGFAGGTWNGFEQYFMVRNSNAHAWCELLDEQGRWLRFDPTPAAGGTGPVAAATNRVAAAADRSWSARMDTLRMFWYRRIVNFDRGTQEQVSGSLRDTLRREGRRAFAAIERWGRSVQEWLLRPWSFGRLLRWATVGAVLAVLGWALWHWRLLWLSRLRRRADRDPVRRAAGRWLRRFAAADYPAELAAVTAELQRLRYGPREGRPPVAAVLRAAQHAWGQLPRSRRRPGAGRGGAGVGGRR